MRDINIFLWSRQLLLRKKAAEELKKEQERKAAERRRIIEERCGKPKNLDDTSEGKAPGPISSPCTDYRCYGSSNRKRIALYI